MQIWDFIMDYFKRFDIDILLYFQIVLSGMIIAITLFIIFILFFFIGKFLFSLFYFIFFFCFGGCWFIPFSCYDEKCHCDEKECEVCNNKECLNKIFCGKGNLEKIKGIFIGS